MRKYTFVLAATAIVLTATLAGAHAQTPAHGATNPVTISPEQLHSQIDGRSLPITYVEELF